ncbi:MAG TPA: hypothetical protein H9716_01265 [Candidatus Enterocloster faecavium]|uniref:Uncharacterized protein n=1 Tax=Candidatus Enterocloster faecavium TaxID=2838560 RepID=A0A9D2L5X0_9FIRM|nr:hypothetical protein [Candidatus Enterocloster faecavium]
MNLKRIAALLGALFFMILAVAAFVLAVAGVSFEVLAALLFCLVLIPIIAYAMLLAARVFRKDKRDEP